MLSCVFQLFQSQAITLLKVHLGQKLLTKPALLTLPASQSIQSSSLSMPQLAYLQGGLNQNFSRQPHTAGSTLPNFPAIEVWSTFLCPAGTRTPKSAPWPPAAAALTKPGGPDCKISLQHYYNVVPVRQPDL